MSTISLFVGPAEIQRSHSLSCSDKEELDVLKLGKFLRLVAHNFNQPTEYPLVNLKKCSML